MGNNQFFLRIPRGLELVGQMFSWCCELATYQEMFPYGTTARDTFQDLNAQVSSALQNVMENNLKIGNYSASVRLFLEKNSPLNFNYH
jgi:hypothetical protein